MDVIGHETVSPYVTPGFWFCSGNQFKICQIVFCMKKSFLPAVSALRDVMGVTGNNEPGDAGHCKSRQLKMFPFAVFSRENCSGSGPFALSGKVVQTCGN